MARPGHDRVLEVAADELHPPGDRTQPDVVRVSWQPGLREHDELGAPLCGLLDVTDGPPDPGFDVEERRRGLHRGDLERLRHDALP